MGTKCVQEKLSIDVEKMSVEADTACEYLNFRTSSGSLRLLQAGVGYHMFSKFVKLKNYKAIGQLKGSQCRTATKLIGVQHQLFQSVPNPLSRDVKLFDEYTVMESRLVREALRDGKYAAHRATLQKAMALIE